MLGFLTGESFSDRLSGLIEFVFGKILTFSLERTAAFFLSSYFLIDSYKEFSSRSAKNFS